MEDPQAEDGGAPRAGPGPISAVVVNYNGAEHLGPCLAGLESQSLAIDEVLVVDNASTDGSSALVAELCPRARCVELSVNDGPCPARNAGLREAQHEWVLLLDNDAVLEPEALERMVRAARDHPRAAMLQPRSVLDAEPTRVHYDGGRFHYAGLFSLRNFYRPLDEAEGVGTLEVDGAVSVCLLVRRDLLLDCGGFDEAFFILFEDLDLSYRLRLLDHSILSVEDAIVRHRAGTPGISFRSGDYPRSRVFLHSRNRWLLLAKNWSARTLLVALPGLLLYEVFWALFALASGGLLAWFSGKLAFLRLLPATLRKRARIQRSRVLSDADLLVGGPLTPAPHLRTSRLRTGLLRLLDRGLAVWWRVARPLCS